MGRVTVVGLAALAALSCDSPPQGEVMLDQLDVVAYGESVHPVVEAHCATLDCHGLAGRPLRLYAETGLRLRDELRDTALTDEEIALDVASFAAVDPPHLGTRDHLVLRKGLAVAAGGIHHEGLVHWQTRDDPGWQCLALWLSGQTGPAFADFCDAAYEAKPLNPE